MEKPRTIRDLLAAIVLLLIGGVSGGTLDYFFGVQEQVELENRSQRVAAYLAWIAAQEDLGLRDSEDPRLKESQIKELQARSRAVVFGSKDVLESQAAFNRASARRKYSPDEIAEALAKEATDAKSLAEKSGRILLSLRRDFHENDDLSWQAALTVRCPNPGRCEGQYLASHLFDPKFLE